LDSSKLGIIGHPAVSGTAAGTLAAVDRLAKRYIQPERYAQFAITFLQNFVEAFLSLMCLLC
jgi:histone H3/H4